jgi:hypothetical protein
MEQELERNKVYSYYNNETDEYMAMFVNSDGFTRWGSIVNNVLRLGAGVYKDKAVLVQFEYKNEDFENGMVLLSYLARFHYNKEGMIKDLDVARAKLNEDDNDDNTKGSLDSTQT